MIYANIRLCLTVFLTANRDPAYLKILIRVAADPMFLNLILAGGYAVFVDYHSLAGYPMEVVSDNRGGYLFRTGA